MIDPTTDTRGGSMKSATLAAVAVAAVVFAACSGDVGPSRAETVEPITGVAVPERFADWSAESAALVDELGAACVDIGGEAMADQQLVDAALVQADVVRFGWAELEPFWFGPAADRRSKYLVDWEIAPAEVDTVVNGADPIDAASVRDVIGADQRGLEAIEYLFAGPVDGRDCEYAQAIGAVISEEAEALATAWTTFGPQLAVDDAAANDALTNMVSESLFVTSSVGDGDGSELQAHRLAGVRWVMVGDETIAGLAPLLSPEVLELLTSDLDAAAADPQGQPVSYVQSTIQTNVVSELGIPVMFSDADGDGGS
jgi:predicted lipoprotein